VAQGRGIGSPVCQGAEGSSDEVKGRGFGNGGGVEVRGRYGAKTGLVPDCCTLWLGVMVMRSGLLACIIGADKSKEEDIQTQTKFSN